MLLDSTFGLFDGPIVWVVVKFFLYIEGLDQGSGAIGCVSWDAFEWRPASNKRPLFFDPFQ